MPSLKGEKTVTIYRIVWIDMNQTTNWHISPNKLEYMMKTSDYSSRLESKTIDVPDLDKYIKGEPK